ncbi:MAG: hypothetical protein ACI36X_01740 [Bacteroidaceae bacterium]
MLLSLLFFLQSWIGLDGGLPCPEEILPKVAPYVTRYGYFNYEETNGYHAHQSVAYNPITNHLYFGIKNSYEDMSEAYVYETDMQLNEVGRYRLEKAYHINDMMFSEDYRSVMIAPLDTSKPYLRMYSFPDFTYVRDVDLSDFFPQDEPIDAVCNAHEDSLYVVKARNRIVLLDYEFREKGTIEIDQADKHGDPLLSQAMEYYQGYILQLNAGSYSHMGTTRNMYLNVIRADGSKVETYRYPDSEENMEAEGICCIGGGKYLITAYLGTKIEVRLLDFNLPTHTHSCADLLDLDKTNVIEKSQLSVRPSAPAIGQSYFDTAVNKPLWWNGAHWVDAAGKEYK